MPIEKVKLGKAIDSWIKSLELDNPRESTVLQRQRTLAALTRVAGGDNVYVRTLTHEHFLNALMDLKNGADDAENEQRRLAARRPRTGRGPDALKIDRTGLTSFMAFCKDMRWLARSVPPLPKPRKTVANEVGTNGAPEDRRIVPKDEWLDLLDAAERVGGCRTRTMVAFALLRMRRASEIAGLKWGHINLGVDETSVYNQKRGRQLDVGIGGDLGPELVRWRTWVSENIGIPQPDWYLFPAVLPVTEIWKLPPVLARDIQAGRAPRPFDPHRQWQTIYLARETQKVLREHGWTGSLKGEGIHTLRRSSANAADEMGLAGIGQALMDQKNAATFERYAGNRAGRRKAVEFTKQEDPWQLQPVETVTPSNVIPFQRRAAGDSQRA